MSSFIPPLVWSGARVKIRSDCNELFLNACCRDRLIGLLTERAAKTLLYYLSETNLNVYHWFGVYIKENPIPRVRYAAFILGAYWMAPTLCGPNLHKWHASATACAPDLLKGYLLCCPGRMGTGMMSAARHSCATC